MNDHRSLGLAAAAYYWKPGMAWFRALELERYRSTGVVLPGPVLDLGCGDGRVAGMLRQMGLIEEPIIGIDLAGRQLSRAAQAGTHAGLARADGGQLPFADGSFASVLCNGSLSSIPGGPGDALSEVHRVLAPGGLFLATFPTDRFVDVLLWPRLLAVWPAARRTYERRMSLRQPHFTADSSTAWVRRLKDAGLDPEHSTTFLSRRAGEIWNLLSMHALRFAGVLRLLPGVAGPSAAALAAALAGAYDAESFREGNGYMLVVARRPAEGQRPGAPL